ncbi:hypothetical protein GCM10020295_01150 [Streptomyces cinereospinus]
MMVTAATLQEAFVIETSLQPRVVASRSKAGNHWAAWESPKSTTVREDARFP